MKFRSFGSYTSTLAALAGMPLLVQSAPTTPTPTLGQSSVDFDQHSDYRPAGYQSNWNDDQRRELRHIFYQLEHANRNYEGHRANAVNEIRRASDEMGMDLHGTGYSMQWQGSPNYGGYDRQTETTAWSDNSLRRCQDRLRDLANSTQDPVRHHLYNAIHELDRALDVHDHD